MLSFEGPDEYSRAGGLATRVEGLAETLATLGFETHLWFIGDPEQPGHEIRGSLYLHRWAQWLSRHHPGGVYDGELPKGTEYARTLPRHLMPRFLVPHFRRGGHAVILAEEWQTAEAVIELDRRLRRAGGRERVTMLWNANNLFGFDRIPWSELSGAATITTVSRMMRLRMEPTGVAALVVTATAAAAAAAGRGSAADRDAAVRDRRHDGRPGRRLREGRGSELPHRQRPLRRR